MEYFDVVDEYGTPTGEVVERAEAHRLGVRHRTAHIWIANETDGKVRVLLQKRSEEKDSFPGCYDTSSAGHITAGDEPLHSALRELREELGITASAEDLTFIGTFCVGYEMTFHRRPFRDSEITFVYIYTKPVDISALHLQKEEVESVAWFDLDELCGFLEPRDSRFCVPIKGFRLAESWCREHLCRTQNDDRVVRITEMENVLDSTATAIRALDDDRAKLESLRPEIDRLIDYYQNGQWMEDFEAKEEGQIPASIKCGVLSEDAVYDLLTDLVRLGILPDAEESEED